MGEKNDRVIKGFRDLFFRRAVLRWNFVNTQSQQFCSVGVIRENENVRMLFRAPAARVLYLHEVSCVFITCV